MVARHGAALLRVANQFSLCQDDALDAYQRGLEIYLRRLETVDPATEGAWLRVVIKHEAMAIRRARQESVDRDAVDLDASVPAGMREVEDVLAGGERVERSVEALRALKPDEARALLLKAEGLSYQEIGRRFGWTYTKVNRSITEGRKRFLNVFGEIESGETCQSHAEALSALAAGNATSAQIVSMRPHLRHCAACRATVRELRFSRTRRIALFAPFAWITRLLSRPELFAASTGGGRLGPAAAAIGLCLSGVGAGAACIATGALPPPPLIADSEPAAEPQKANKPERSTPRREPARRPVPAPTRTAPVHLATSTPTPAPTAAPRPKRVKQATPRPKVKAKQASRTEFDFENKAGSPAPVATRAPVIARAARVGGGGSSGPRSGGGGPRPAATGSPGSEFGFEGG
jgi:RNA polymerase sigma factor (sigma-70 family)